MFDRLSNYKKVVFEKKKDSSALHPAVKINIVDFSAMNASIDTARLDVDFWRFNPKLLC